MEKFSVQRGKEGEIRHEIQQLSSTQDQNKTLKLICSCQWFPYGRGKSMLLLFNCCMYKVFLIFFSSFISCFFVKCDCLSGYDIPFMYNFFFYIEQIERQWTSVHCFSAQSLRSFFFFGLILSLWVISSQIRYMMY